MDEKKFGNILTFLLIVLIVIILAIVSYFGYSAYSRSRTKANAENALQEFEQTSKPATKKKEDTASDTANTTGDEDPLSKLNASTTETTGSSKKDAKKTYMENYEVLGTIKIPKIKLEYPVLAKVTKRSLEISVAKFDGPGLNEVGNTTIMGHNYRNGMFFSNNHKLSNGDEILITDQTGTTITYEIYKMYYTDPSDADYMRRDTEGKREISLSTCNDDSSERLVIWAVEK